MAEGALISNITPPPDEVLASRRKRRKRWLGLALVAGAVAALLIAIGIALTPRRLKPGEVIAEFGTFRSPAGRSGVVIRKADQGLIELTLQRPMEVFSLIAVRGDSSVTQFDAEREWFVAFDEFERLWVYIGPWDKRWGKTHEFPGGSFRPHVPSVTVDGLFVTQSRVEYGHAVVSSTGDWDGVPIEFFQRIPGKQASIWGDAPPIPESPPVLTEALRQQMEARVRGLRWR